MTAPWYRYSGDSSILTLVLQVQPNAHRTEVVGLHGDALKIRLAAPAVDQKANTCLIGFVAESFGVPVRQVRLLRGATSRRKLIEVRGPRRPPEVLKPLTDSKQ
jgi:uncharacterized protein (TIGR00251 family)